jgi:hypothetical protein
MKNKKISKLLNGNNSYLSIPDTKDWEFGNGNGDFTICGYFDKLGKYSICTCKYWTKCKGFKNEK